MAKTVSNEQGRNGGKKKTNKARRNNEKQKVLRMQELRVQDQLEPYLMSNINLLLKVVVFMK